MLPFFKILLHVLYLSFLTGHEVLLWHWLLPLIGVGLTVAVLIVVFIVLIMIYAAAFWGWRPSGGDGVGDSFSDIGDFGGDSS